VEIAIDFYARLRGQVKYAGREALIKQMHADVEERGTSCRSLTRPSASHQNLGEFAAKVPRW
jgi:hypothetical protein